MLYMKRSDVSSEESKRNIHFFLRETLCKGLYKSSSLEFSNPMTKNDFHISSEYISKVH